MTQPRRRTLARPVSAKGIGLHCGERIKIELAPAETAGGGIVFERIDLRERPRIAARPESVDREALARRTGLRSADGVTVATVEHLLAACAGLGVDDLLVRLDGPEVPIFDGSAQRFAKMIATAGTRKLDLPRQPLRLRRTVVLAEGNAEICAVPAEAMELVFFADLARAGLPPQVASFRPGQDDFKRELAPARTFVFEEDVEKLREAGLIRGGSLDCAIVLRGGVPVDTKYRFPNELARHKLLDFLGDLAILGRPVAALLTARGSGHRLHSAFVEALRKELFE